MHQMNLEIIENKHQWHCKDCGRTVSIEGNNYAVINKGEPLALHDSPALPGSDMLGLDFEADVVPPEEQATLDRWRSAFNDV